MKTHVGWERTMDRKRTRKKLSAENNMKRTDVRVSVSNKKPIRDRNSTPSSSKIYTEQGEMLSDAPTRMLEDTRQSLGPLPLTSPSL